jgi:hypothetical protein
VESVTVTPSSDTLQSLGETVSLAVSSFDASGNVVTGRSYTWESSDTDVATVSGSGVVTAIENGTAVITATTGDASGSASILVRQEPFRLAFVTQPSLVPADSIISPAIEVGVNDAMGNAVVTAAETIYLELGGVGPGPVTVNGAVAVDPIAGVATFGDLAIDTPHADYYLTATMDGVPPTSSDSFDVVLAFSSVDVGGAAACGITVDSAAFCWGQLTAGIADTSTNRPVPVAGGLSYWALSLGVTHSCGLTADSTAVCWGTNHEGTLGDGTSTSSTVPVPVSGGHKYVMISAGAYHTCGVTTAGEALCWGHNDYGELGNGSGTWSDVPVSIGAPLSVDWISAGVEHTCAVTDTGAAYCWGTGRDGRLGNGTETDADLPSLVSGAVVFTQVVAGGAHSCGMDGSGAVHCWGRNESGEFGDGTRNSSDVPVAAIGGQTLTSVRAGTHFNCGVTAAQDVLCWGWNPNGLGDGTTLVSDVPVTVAGDYSFAMVGGGFGYTCGVTDRGLAFCWGSSNAFGELGDGTGFTSNAPVRVAPLLP